MNESKCVFCGPYCHTEIAPITEDGEGICYQCWDEAGISKDWIEADEEDAEAEESIPSEGAFVDWETWKSMMITPETGEIVASD